MNVELWPDQDKIVVTDSHGTRAYSIEEADDLSKELGYMVREAYEPSPFVTTYVAFTEMVS